ncbi:MAG TPA: MiaB/RimO family radical SAM methylthiotransferase [Gemmatimonadaceae bacterium]|nr:MiaB/RimO family radical SAM methylthiotransferase [Gemmatimonadaceae bacterium]
MKLYLRTFGCRANHYDTEMVRALAVRGGHEIVEDAAAADLAVVNSCAVTAEAERDARKAVRRLGGENPRLRTLVMGCSAALPQSASVLRELPTVQHVIAGADRQAIATALGVPLTDDVLPQSTVRAVLRIQDGCDEHCTFCATTIARGANRSRSVESLVREARALSEHHHEIVITGTHIGSYGRDGGSSLGALMERLLLAVPGARFRLSSLEATEVDDRLAELLAGSGGQLAPHLHAPLQSGSDRLLKRMGRHWYSASTYARSVERLAARLPVFALGADVIAAFPGETDADHAATVALVEQLPFTYLHVFTYSPRPGTAATRLPGHVPLAAAQARSHELRHLGQKKGKEYRAARAGTAADLIVISSGADREALSEDYLTVRVTASKPRGERFTGRLSLEGDALACLDDEQPRA